MSACNPALPQQLVHLFAMDD